MADKENVKYETDPLALNKPSLPVSKKLAAIPAISQPDNKVVTLPAEDPSKLGRFGWCSLSTVFLPTLFRQNTSFISVRILEKMLLSKYLQLLPHEAVACSSVDSFRVTEDEARILNEINTKHVDLLFGRDSFTTKDLIVKVEDVVIFYEFLELCHKKLILKQSAASDKCGFTRIGGLSDVPHVKVETKNYLPLFYFDGDVDKQCVTLRGMDWAYLKFCCKVQGVKDELICSDVCEAVAEEDMKDYFPLGTTFVDYWPTKDYIHRMATIGQFKVNCWTRVITNPEGEKFLGRLTLIKEFPFQQIDDAPPYKANKALILKKIVPCINIRPFQFMEVMVTLPHLVGQLFPIFTEKQVGNMLVSMPGVVLYKGNKGHEEVIRQEGWEDGYDRVPLVTMKDILSNLESLKSAAKSGDLGGKRSNGS